MTVYAVYRNHQLVCRTADPAVAEKVRTSVDGVIVPIEHQATFAERQGAA